MSWKSSQENSDENTGNEYGRPLMRPFGKKESLLRFNGAVASFHARTQLSKFLRRPSVKSSA